jgi:DNA invertase Pin-like site-specific DNA recombinase
MKINQNYGYVRVSYKSQESNSSLQYQKHLLIQNGIKVENIRIEIGSPANDFLMVTKIDRCSRNTL